MLMKLVGGQAFCGNPFMSHGSSSLQDNQTVKQSICDRGINISLMLLWTGNKRTMKTKKKCKFKEC
jgi:hypothetical protein